MESQAKALEQLLRRSRTRNQQGKLSLPFSASSQDMRSLENLPSAFTQNAASPRPTNAEWTHRQPIMLYLTVLVTTQRVQLPRTSTSTTKQVAQSSALLGYCGTLATLKRCSGFWRAQLAPRRSTVVIDPGSVAIIRYAQ